MHFVCAQDTILTIDASSFRLSLNENLQVYLEHQLGSTNVIMEEFQSSDYLMMKQAKIDQYSFQDIKKSSVLDELGSGTAWTITGENKTHKIQKTTVYTVYKEFPQFIFTQTEFKNNSSKKLLIESWNTNQINLKNLGHSPAYYAFQGSSTSARKDWIREIEDFYFDENYMGMNNSDYGGGIPIVDVWRKDIGVAIGHAEPMPKLVSFPTELLDWKSDVSISMSESFDYPNFLSAHDSYSTPTSFYYVHEGDYFQTLSDYSEMMTHKGIEMAPTQADAYEPIWCAWGYERNFTKEEILGTLDKVKELGIKWVVVDDGFQVAEGNWNLDKEKFPRGNIEMKELVDAIHQKDLKAKIWWTPLAADPGSQILQDHPNAYLYTEEWAPQFITWWDSYYLSPTNISTVDHTKQTLNLFLNEWGFDGMKMDGQHMNAVPPDHNPEAGIDDPIHSTERLPDFFQMIYDESVKINPNVVVENCPCGTCMSYFNMKSINQTVSSDPLSSWQIRHKGKTYKALVPQIAYYGDHVELSDNANDFVSSFGIGAVLGTKFTYPADNPTASESFLLTPEKEKIWKKWFSLYNEHMISNGHYLGALYDIGYDKPETHVIQKNGTLYFAFYSDCWDGEIEFRGLDSSFAYSIYDYVNHEEVGYLEKGESKANVQFTNSLLVQLLPSR